MKPTNDRHIVFAYDPGLVTGWACYEPATAAFANGQVDGRHEFYRQFEQTIEYGGTIEVVGEKFVIGVRTQDKTPQYDALYINGTIDYLSQKLGFSLALQTPAQAKAFATDAKLKALDWYKPTKGGHANDASRHLLTYIAKRAAGRPELLRIVEALGV